MMNRYERIPAATLTRIEASNDFVRMLAFRIEAKYNDPKACLSTFVQTYNNFTGGWR
jgi:hypothetical protein